MEQQPGGTGGGMVCEKCGASFETQERSSTVTYKRRTRTTGHSGTQKES
jgi:hypothetical protein